LTQKSTILVVKIFPNSHFLSLGRNPATPSLSSQQKMTKKRKIKLGTKIYCLEIQGTDHLIYKKYGGLKLMFQRNFQPTPHVTRDFHFSPLSFNLTLPPKNICNWGSIWAQKGHIAQNKSLRTKIKITKNCTAPIHSVL